MISKADKIFYHPNFSAAFRSLPTVIKEKAIAKEALFRESIFHPLLRTHKLRGRLAGLYAFSVDARCRILFKFYKTSVMFLDVDDHDLYR